MRVLLLCCLVALAVCQKSLRYDLSLNPNKIYEYQYEGWVKFGLGKPNHAESGARLKCSVQIVGATSNTFLLQFSNVVFEEFNGFPGKSDFVAANQVAEKIAAQLAKPIEFTYSAGNVGEIRASPEVTDTVVNIVRGILGFFQVTVKTNQDIYELEEIGIHGKCLSSYATKINAQEKVMDLTQVVDVTNCREKAAFYFGMATAVEDKVSKQRGESVFSTVKYTYNIKATEEAGLITKAQALELQYFTPFNVKGGSFKMEAMKELVLTTVKDKTQNVRNDRQMESRGNIIFKVVKNWVNMPVTMQRMDDPVTKATELIKRLAQANTNQIDSTTNEDAIKLYQLLRVIPLEKLEKMWRDMEGNLNERNWFLHTVVEVNDARILNFLERLLRERKLQTFEAITVIVRAFNHLEATPELLRMAGKFLTMTYNDAMIRRTVVLSYGSLVYKHCAYNTPCPEEAVKPLLDMAEESRRNNNEMETVLVLKALGNAGHPRSLKTIEKFLPGVDPNTNQAETKARVVSAAVQAMRLIATRDPHGVQLRTLKLFLNRELKPEIRMLALMMMFDTKPTIALVSTVTAHLLEERDMQVVNFAYTYFKSLSRAMTPDNHFLSTASSVAVKILAPKFRSLDYYQSRAARMDWFSDDYLIGTAAEAFILKRASQVIPAEMMVKWNFHFFGRILQLLEFGVRPEGLRTLFGANIPEFRGDMSVTDFQAIFDILKKWETLPEDKPLLSIYTRASGQEFFFNDFNKDFVERVMRVFSPSAGKDSFMWRMIEQMKQGFSVRGVLPFLTVEARYIQATTLGLPLEISKYYHVASGLSVNVHATINKQAAETVGDLLSAETELRTDGFIGYTKNFWLFYGINTDLFQSAVEIKTTNPARIPWNFVAKLNVPERKFEVEFPRSKSELEFFSFSSNAYAISRNIIHPEAAKKIQLIPNEQSVSQTTNSKLSQPNKWHPVKTMCSKSTIFGVSLCSEYELRRVYYQKEYPLYYFLGFTHFALKVAPVQEATAVDKIRLEINAAPTAASEDVRQLLNNLRRMSKEVRSSSSGTSQEQQDRPSRGMQETPVPVLNFKVLALGQKTEGFDVSFYYMPEGESRSTQFIVTQVGQSSNWKMCVDAAVAEEAKAQVAWGAECKPYALSVRSAYVSGNRPELKAVMHWDQVPEDMMEIRRTTAKYIPGMAFLLGFTQEEEKNSMQEISASVIAASADSVDVTIKFPELTLRREALPSPMEFSRNRTINSVTQM
ncbi:vitellogenin 3, phosvitinless isoform X2 [Eucyclogobius newberryi]|uniref:vitellogenin 3, phosvitinless isoform X2 n=1 Tax=Eucyclogobius newberryi TaxID=166745 RepID=UPI003B5A1F8C